MGESIRGVRHGADENIYIPVNNGISKKEDSSRKAHEISEKTAAEKLKKHTL